MEKLKAEAIHRELNLIAKELQAFEEKKKWKDIRYEERRDTVEEIAKKVGLGRHIHENINVYTRVGEKDGEVKIEITWASLKSHDLAQAKKFIADFSDIIKRIPKFVDALKKEYPEVKIKGI